MLMIPLVDGVPWATIYPSSLAFGLGASVSLDLEPLTNIVNCACQRPSVPRLHLKRRLNTFLSPSGHAFAPPCKTNTPAQHYGRGSSTTPHRGPPARRRAARRKGDGRQAPHRRISPAGQRRGAHRRLAQAWRGDARDPRQGGGRGRRRLDLPGRRVDGHGSLPVHKSISRRFMHDIDSTQVTG